MGWHTQTARPESLETRFLGNTGADAIVRLAQKLEFRDVEQAPEPGHTPDRELIVQRLFTCLIIQTEGYSIVTVAGASAEANIHCLFARTDTSNSLSAT